MPHIEDKLPFYVVFMKEMELLWERCGKKGEKKLAREEEFRKSADGSADFFLCIPNGKKKSMSEI